MCVSQLLNSYDLCLIQEHWLLPNHINKLNLSNDFLSAGISSMDDSESLLVRPYGGCGIIYRKSLSPLIRSIDSHSKRFCAISVTLNDFKKGTNFVLLIICVYLPTDYGSASSDACFTESLGELEGFIQSVSFDNNCHLW